MSDNLYTPFKQPPKSSSGKPWYWVLGGCGFVTLLLFCGGGIAAVIFGLNLVEEDLKVQLRDLPQVRQHLGELQTIEVNFLKSGTVEDDALVYDATGTKGSAELTVVSVTSFDGPEEIESAVMRLPDGQVIEIDLEQ